MSYLPVRFRPAGHETALCVGHDGRFAMVDQSLVKRCADGTLTSVDRAALTAEGLSLDEADRLGRVAHLYRTARRTTVPNELNYLILVPTLRCNLACSYCQVSRVAERADGFDWSPAVTAAVLDQIDALDASHVKIEFQGGEPTLRLDLIETVIARCQRFAQHQFVICTNLQQLSDDIIALFDRPDVFISTSLDGAAATHQRNRTGDSAMTDQFFRNLEFVVERYGPEKVSALPTIDPLAPPKPTELIDLYAKHGLDSIFLRPINYQGFARKKHAAVRELDAGWRAYHEHFIRCLIERNWADRSRVMEETYFSICLRRVFRPWSERHVDLRDPNPVGRDYVVVDYDGTVYPTDEARMLARSGVIDLAIGDVFTGWEGERRDLLNAHATNRFDPVCNRCAYQPYCGRDLIDDLARYGRIDKARDETEFCRRHLAMFDLTFDLLYSDDPAVRYSLARWLRLPAIPDRFGERIQ